MMKTFSIAIAGLVLVSLSGMVKAVSVPTLGNMEIPAPITNTGITRSASIPLGSLTTLDWDITAANDGTLTSAGKLDNANNPVGTAYLTGEWYGLDVTVGGTVIISATADQNFPTSGAFALDIYGGTETDTTVYNPLFGTASSIPALKGSAAWTLGSWIAGVPSAGSSTPLTLTLGTGSYLLHVVGTLNPGGGSPPGNINAGWNIDVSSVPVPAAVWLFGTALIGLLGLRRKLKSDVASA